MQSSFYVDWSEAAKSSLLDLAEQSESFGKQAGRLYCFVDQLTPERVKSLPSARHRLYAVHWWSPGELTVFLLLTESAVIAVEVALTKTQHQFDAARRTAFEQCELIWARRLAND